jgi:hypothetical protein
MGFSVPAYPGKLGSRCCIHCYVLRLGSTRCKWYAFLFSSVTALLKEVLSSASMPTVGQSLSQYNYHLLRYFLPASLIISVLPLPEWVYTGNKGLLFLAPIAPIILLIASGLVCVVWWILFSLLAVIGKLSTFIYGRSVSSLNERRDLRTDTNTQSIGASQRASKHYSLIVDHLLDNFRVRSMASRLRRMLAASPLYLRILRSTFGCPPFQFQ